MAVCHFLMLPGGVSSSRCPEEPAWFVEDPKACGDAEKRKLNALERPLDLFMRITQSDGSAMWTCHWILSFSQFVE